MRETVFTCKRRSAFLDPAQFIEEKSSLDFAMVAAAHRAQVSSTAPYRHFKDKDALLQAVPEMAFMGLASPRAVPEAIP